MTRLATLLLAITASPLVAQTGTPMTGEDYNALVAGRTYYINVPGQPAYGIEAYLPDQRVAWGFLATNECLDGEWFEAKPTVICYAYEDGVDELHCWQYFQTNGQLFAQLTDQGGKALTDAPYEVFETDASLPCVQDFLGS